MCPLLQKLHGLVVAITLRSEMCNPNRSANAATKSTNRIGAVMIHCPRYAFRGVSRLARDSQLAKSTVNRLIRGKTNPLYSTIEKIVKAVGHEVGRTLPQEELVTTTGKYPTPYVCPLLNCAGCLPDEAYKSDGSIRPSWTDVEPGRWTGDCAEPKLAQILLGEVEVSE